MMASDDRRDGALADALSEFLDRLNEGEAPSVEGFLRDHADLATELRPLLETAIQVGSEVQAVLPRQGADSAFAEVRTRFLQSQPRAEYPNHVAEGVAPIAITKRPDLLILLLHTMEEFRGITQAVKMALLLGEEGGAKRFVPDYYQHVAHNYGPFDKAVYDDIEGLKQAGIIEVVPSPRRRGSAQDEIGVRSGPRGVEARFRLTPRGRKFAKALAMGAEARDPAILRGVRDVSDRFGRLPHKQLLQYVYRQYPELTTKSKIRDEILGDEE